MEIPELSTLNRRPLEQRFLRFVQYLQAKYSRKFTAIANSLAAYIPPGGVVFDVGAHHGKFAKEFARVRDGSCQVYCFEPLEYNYTILDRVMRSRPNVKVFDLALSDKSGTADLYVPVRKSNKHVGSVYAHLGTPEGRKFFAGERDHWLYRTAIQSKPLDEIMRRERIERLDFMKVDVEGAETLVFKGSEDSLHRYKPAVFCEIAPGHPERLGLKVEDSVRMLASLGYRMWLPDLQSGGIKPCEDCLPQLTDYLCLHPENPLHMTGRRGK